jgi:uncharacterized repeat protein (TIGR01451 family)
MLYRIFSAFTILILLAASIPPSPPEPIGVEAAAPIDPLSPNAVCLYVPPATQSASASSTAWQFEPSMPTPRHSFGFVWLPATYNVYAIGGMLGWEEAVTATERYDACSKSWTAMAPLPQPRGYVQAAELNGKLYVVGGVDRVISDTYQVHNETWVYDPIGNTWSQAANFPQALGSVTLAVVNSRLYAFGGFDARGPGAGDVANTYVYNPDNNTWLARTAIFDGPRSLAGAARLNDKVYVVGGTISGSLGGSASVNVYDPAKNSWSVAAPLREGMHSPSVAVLPDVGLLYVVGGGVEWYSWVAGQVYDPATDTWSYMDDVYSDFTRVGSGLTYVAGRLVLAGGTDRTYDLTTNKVEAYRLRDDFCNSTVSADQSVIQPGTHIVYTIELHSDIEWLNAAQVINTIPAGTSFDGFIGSANGATYDNGLRQVKWKGQIISHSPPIQFSYSIYVPLEGWHDGQTITNTAIFNDGLGHTFNRSAVTAIQAFDLSSSTKTVDRTRAASGDILTYDIHMHNASDERREVNIYDYFPSYTTYVSGSLTATQGTAYARPDLGVFSRIEWSGDLPYTATYTNTSGDYEWGDSLGRGVVPGVKYDWIEISQTGLQMGFYAPSMGKCYPVPIPFGFNFYGTYYTQAGVQIDGSLYFPEPDEVSTYPGPDNQPIPYDNFSIDRFIAPLWDDLYLWPGGLYYQVLGTEPHRRVVIEYSRFSRLGSLTQPGDTGDLEIILYEGSGDILLQYKDVDFGNPLYDFGASATVGIQNSSTQGVQYSYNTPSLANELAILFLPPGQSVDHLLYDSDVSFQMQVQDAPINTWITNTATLPNFYGMFLDRSASTLINTVDLGASTKSIDPPTASAGEVVTYTISLINMGTLTATATITDPLPGGLTYLDGSSTVDGVPIELYDSATNSLKWTGAVATGDMVSVRFKATLNLPSESVINIVTIDDGAGTILQRVAGGRHVFLPVILR